MRIGFIMDRVRAVIHAKKEEIETDTKEDLQAYEEIRTNLAYNMTEHYLSEHRTGKVREVFRWFIANVGRN